MKKGKINLIIVTCFCLLILCYSVVVSAANANAELIVSKTTAKPGDTITAVLKLNCDSNLNTILANINYDTNVLTLEDAKNASFLTSSYDENYDVVLLNFNSADTDYTTIDDALTLTFTVNSDANDGTTNISLEDVKIYLVGDDEPKRSRIK